MTPTTTVVIPLYNDAASIGKVLDALEIQTDAPPFEVIVVDDGSTDLGPELVQKRATLIRQANAGPAAARNTGAGQAKGDYLLFLDADCTPSSHWVERMTRAMLGTGYEGVMGTLTAANDGVVPRLVQLEVEDRYRSMARARDGVDFIAAPSCGFNRRIFLALGGFNQSLRQAEDVEMGYRFTEAGHRIAFVADAPVAHEHQTTWGEFIRTKYRRAVGRLRVFALFPQKRRHDSWTPLSLKLQFAAIALAVGALALGFVFWPGALVGLGLIMMAILLGWPLVLATARRQASLIGFPRGLGVGAAFVVIRSLVILVAMLRAKLWKFRS
jgi:glycosyltransferase involved in cell wall biosynthesis